MTRIAEDFALTRRALLGCLAALPMVPFAAPLAMREFAIGPDIAMADFVYLDESNYRSLKIIAATFDPDNLARLIDLQRTAENVGRIVDERGLQ